MRVVHESGDNGEDRDDRKVLATDVAVAEGALAKLRGLRFRSSLPEGFALVFPFEGVGRRDIDMLFVRTSIDVLWLVDGHVKRVETLRSWLGFGLAKADCVIELPPGVARNVSTGDRVFLEDEVK
ncbi:DUF192 domain-containing protein [Halorhabdus amylolytica]|uniref:DUF192 domain-containing protein n=1 Tax=Halorhabdus amylolytica TaxID=2559573 RepID=UPI0010AA8C4D|nr:DUF192 domain-containing protein [Halorhabdus amylolytica]